MRLQGTTSKSHIVKNEIILKVLQFIFKPVDMPSVFHELSNSSKLSMFCSPQGDCMKMNFNYLDVKKQMRLF